MRADATGKMIFSPLQKCTSSIRMLAYGSPADIADEYVRIGESTSIECLKRFVRGMNDVFGAEYLRKPNNTDVEPLLQMEESCDFPGSNNDFNMLNQSNVFNEVLEGHAPVVQYTINQTPYNMGYYLADDIYLEWATFVKTISMPQGKKRKLFAQHEESARKNVEGAFRVLQSRFAIIRGSVCACHMETLKHTIYACILLHNMIVEDERHTYIGDFDYSYDNVDTDNSTTETFKDPHLNLAIRLYKEDHVFMKKKFTAYFKEI